jgi:hypothetical protein
LNFWYPVLYLTIFLLILAILFCSLHTIDMNGLWTTLTILEHCEFDCIILSFTPFYVFFLVINITFSEFEELSSVLLIE